ncbi:MAG: murein biosynthesis integral membrane protein MurJ, partial [Candidatus Omnitrophica bacterium]|nr:murein biosynthesis integral membrane protein MurJ [Candidatus Omnitrophota bacterium]
MSSSKSITKSASVIGGATMISRILGMVRDIIMAKFFGTGIYAQAFFVAFRMPNLMRELVGEGAANSAFVPVLVSELVKKGKDEFWKVANILFNFFLIVISIITIFGFILAPQIVYLTAPGFSADLSKFAVTVSLTRVIFPYLIFIGMAAYCMGLLNSLNHFAMPAFGPSMLNLSLILCMLIFKTDVIGLAIGVLIGGLLQVLIQLPPLIKHGIHFKENKIFHPAVQRIGKLLLPRTLGAGIYQINVIVTQILASFGMIVGSNAVAVLQYSNRIMLLPLAIFGNSLAQASLPTLSVHAASNDINKLKNTVKFLLRINIFILLPATAGLIIFSRPVVRMLFERGAFTGTDTALTAAALTCYAIGLVACGAIKVFTNSYYAMHDTLTPAKLSVLSLGVNISLNILLMYPLKAAGLALANSTAAITHACMLYIFLIKKTGRIIDLDVLKTFLKALLASALMGVVCFFVYKFLNNALPPGKTVYIVLNLLASIGIGMVFYAIFCAILGMKEIKDLFLWILRKK